ncbi:MAG: hypothetical protein Q9161_003870 [Pseudevernia consocians]
MPVPRYTKKDRVKGVQIHRPFVYGSIAKPLDPSNRPPGISPEHTHQWSVFVRGVNDEDISYWLKKVQFKLHETYTNSSRMVEAGPFEVTETGWGEFEVQMKLYFVAEANEKAQTLWHALKLHPYAGDVEGQKERRDPIVSQNFEEVVFSEPVEPFYDILTSGPPLPARGKAGKGSKQATLRKQGERSAEIPYANSEGNPFSQKEEGMELDRLKEAMKTVEGMVKEERAKLAEKEKVMEGLKREGAGQQGK